MNKDVIIGGGIMSKGVLDPNQTLPRET